MKRVVVAVCALLVLGGCNSDGSAAGKPRKDKPERVVTVSSTLVSSQSIAESIELVGSLQAEQSVFVAAEVAGRIANIAVTPNQAVSAGQVLLTLDDSLSKATLAEASAYLADESRKLQEYQRLVTNAAITQTEIDGQQASVDIARARLAAAQAQFDYHSVKAPFAGTLGLVDVNLGQRVGSGDALISLDDLSSMRLDLNVPEHLLSRVFVGMPVEASVSAWPSQAFRGEVVAIDSRVQQRSLNLRMQVRFDNPQQLLKPGMLAQVTLAFSPMEHPVIPVQALEYSGTKRYVYLIDDQQRVQRSEVHLGTRVDNRVLIEQGLAVGDRIVVQGLVNMKDGIRIKDLSLATASAGVHADVAL
ncbi:efflux RND transporter periplasmic adaptor subunit [Ferrimonas sp. SCSIO 43195]|uniref:efflux RND transporter periplasmic adaptor subunit n=1 Tax=Ferrimonas sp. SCSIO 43195 TaxID=2822844 RepID=UPI002075B056|nr:efflux RND transporter periplasmic adaptor subunit [Ferrimonas sp. SCSIO 43195]USD36010.1 efflux RND transporter periplasmic adaptor subunit [Ferrimonas sp. SCSIO 43195]